MTNEELDTIDGQLGVTMPLEYRSLTIAPPLGFQGSKAAGWVFDNSRLVVSETQRYRIQGVAEKSFPSEYVVVGEDGTGNFSCLDLSQDPAPVLEFDHERGRFEMVAFSFTSWLKQLLRDLGRST